MGHITFPTWSKTCENFAQVGTTPCNHPFESLDIQKWVQIKGNCPLDNKPVTLANLKITVADKSDLARARCNLGYMYHKGLGGLDENKTKAVQCYTLASEDSPCAQRNLAVMYENGEGIKQDECKAFELYSKAKDRGDAAAQSAFDRLKKGIEEYKQAVKFELGEGVDKNQSLAITHYQEAAKLGIAAANYKIGFFYASGKGLPLNRELAVTYLRKAADKGSPDAQYLLGSMYERRLGGLPRSEEEALKWYQKASVQGDAKAIYRIGYFHDKGLVGLKQDDVESARLYQIAADKGYFHAQRAMGYRYELGSGVALSYDKAIECFHKAAVQGNWLAKQEYLRLKKAVEYYNTSIEYDKESKYALSSVYLDLAAGLGHIDACYKLAHRYLMGEMGCEENLEMAAIFFIKAADKGHSGSQCQLAHMYEYGFGVTQSNDKAVEYYRKAADLGHISALRRLGEITENALLGRKRNFKYAETWYEMAAAKGSLPAIEGVARCKVRNESMKLMLPALRMASLAYYLEGEKTEDQIVSELKQNELFTINGQYKKIYNDIGFITYNGNKENPVITFALTGTKKNFDWAYNLFFIKSDLQDTALRIKENTDLKIKGSGHSGFIERYVSMHQHCMSIVNDLIEDNELSVDKINFVFLGHSLGGAAATVAAVHYKQMVFMQNNMEKKARSVKLITACSPRVFENTEFEKLLGKENILRIWRVEDPISAVPSESSCKHIGTSLKVPERMDGRDLVDLNDPETRCKYHHDIDALINWLSTPGNEADPHHVPPASYEKMIKIAYVGSKAIAAKVIVPKVQNSLPVQTGLAIIHLGGWACKKIGIIE